MFSRYITIQTTGTEYQKAVITADIISSLKKIPASVLQEFKENGYTFSFISNGTASADPDGLYYNAGGTGGYITVRSASNKVITHEFGHFVFDHRDILAEIESLLKDPKEIAGVKLISASDYCKTSPSEFFAEAFFCYICFPDMLKTNALGTITLIDRLFN
ncbi:MAG: hypothetical protein CVU91_06045 [Firmicutes bacterium HGW-Firmicutes-16]|nr:MAG: hypothetical protein CVU91_06045 [Firmicutes bacterium HGW-Firmicutes-16]